MPDPRWLDLPGRALPPVVRRDVYEPSVRDARIEFLQRRVAARSPVRRGLARAAFALTIAAVLLGCLRLAPGACRADRRDRRRASPRTPMEITPMVVYLFRHAFRLLARERAFTTAAVLTLALGVGANVAIFAVVNAVMLRPLPYPDAASLVILEHRDERTGITKAFIAIGDFVDLRKRQTSFESVAGYGDFAVTVNAGADPFRASALLAGPGLLETLRAAPVMGRAFTEADSRKGAAPIALLGYDLWQTRFGSDPAVIGRRIRVGTDDTEIVGIAPPGFRFPAGARTDIILPYTLPEEAPAGRKNGWAFAVARLKPGVSFDAAATELSAISRQLAQEYPASNQGSMYFPIALRDALLGDTKGPLLLLAAAVCVVLLIACANVGNLLLARALGRRHEMAVRVALGASRARLAAQLLVESLTLALVAGTAGVLIAYWGVPALVALVPRSMSVPGLATAGIDLGVVAFTLALSVATAIAFSLISVLMVRTEHGTSALTAQTRVTTSPTARRATSGLVVVEIALAVVLLVGAGLILRSFSRLVSVNPGFTLERVLVLTTSLPAERYGTPEARRAFYARTFESIHALPGVEGVGAAAVVPLTGNNWTVPFERADRPVPAGERPPDVGWQNASGGYFQALRIPLVAGRFFDARDAADGPASLIISDAIQRQYFGTEPAVGRRLKLGDQEGRIVGVVGDIRRAGLTDAPRADMYFPFERQPAGTTSLFIRTSGDPLETLPSVQATLKAAEPGLVTLDTQTMESIASESVAVTRLALWLLGLFAIVALALAAIGIYGVMSYAVRQRTREIGTRIALGASRRDIVWTIMKQGAGISAVGLGIGVAAGLAVAQSLTALLYGVSPADPVTVASALGLLAAATLVACYVPARRAARVDAARTMSM